MRCQKLEAGGLVTLGLALAGLAWAFAFLSWPLLSFPFLAVRSTSSSATQAWLGLARAGLAWPGRRPPPHATATTPVPRVPQGTASDTRACYPAYACLALPQAKARPPWLSSAGPGMSPLARLWARHAPPGPAPGAQAVHRRSGMACLGAAWDGLGLACLGMAWVGLASVSAGWGWPRLGAHFIAVAADVLLRREEQGCGARNSKPTAW